MVTTKDRKVSVIGQGYVGLPLALSVAYSGWNVIGIEIDPVRFEQLSSGISPIEGTESSQLEEVMQRGQYRVESNFNSLKEADIIVVCVPTPLDEKGKPDLSVLREVVQSIDHFGKPNALIINESTSHPGTLRNIFHNALEYEKSARRFEYAVAPERIDPGNVKFTISNTPRVVGALTENALIRARNFYESFCSQVIIVSSPEVAEMAKLLENTFRLVNISLINEVSKLSARMGLNTREVVDAANTKPFGFMKFLPSIGVGGHCIPIDPIYLTEFARSQGVEQRLIETAKNIDDTMTSWILEQVKKLAPEIRSITVVGVGYKAGSRDTRHSPSIRLIRALRDSGYQVDWLDSIVVKFEHETSNTNLTSQLAIVTAPDSKFDPESYLRQGGKIFDFTGSLIAEKGVFQF